MKRYAIVRVGKYGSCVEEFICSGICKKCNYGDTKEQLIRKVAQAIFRRKLRLYRKIWGGNMGSVERKDTYEKCLYCAKEIVEFLGVEE